MCDVVTAVCLTEKIHKRIKSKSLFQHQMHLMKASMDGLRIGAEMNYLEILDQFCI